MKNLKAYLAIIALIPILFSSCTKEDGISEDYISKDVAVLYLGPVLEGFNEQSTRQQENDIPQCSEDDPAYANIRLTYAPNNTIVETTVKILEDDEGLFTAYDDKLEIPVVSGNTVEITLTDFVVLNENQEPIWVTPKIGSDFAKFVSQPLSMTFDLRAGSKNYVNVDVLCFDDREVNLYGYQFFDITPINLYTFCVFANYCSDSGRHFTADYEFSLYQYFGDDPQNPLQLSNDYKLIVEKQSPNKGNDEGTFWADPYCTTIPGKPQDKGPDEPYLFYSIKLKNWAPNYTTDQEFVKTGYLTWNQIADLLDVEGDDNNTTVDYWHFFFNCGDDDGPVECDLNDPAADCDNDGILNGDENDGCKENPDPDCGEPCTDPTVWYEDADGDGFGDPAVSLEACEQPDGYVDNNLDQCPDENPVTDTNGDGCEDEVECDLNNPNLDCDGDGTFNGVDCDPDNAANNNSNENDADCDGVPTESDCDDNNDQIGVATTTYYADTDLDGLGDPDDSLVACSQPDGYVDNNLDQCPDENPTVDANNDGCEDVVDTCTIGTADADCAKYFLDGSNQFVQVDEPGDFPQLYGLIPQGGEFADRIGSITIQLSDNSEPVVTVILNEGYTVDDYKIEVRNQADSSITCVAEEGVSPPSGDAPDIFEEFSGINNYTYPFFVRIEVNACE